LCGSSAYNRKTIGDAGMSVKAELKTAPPALKIDVTSYTKINCLTSHLKRTLLNLTCFFKLHPSHVSATFSKYK